MMGLQEQKQQVVRSIVRVLMARIDRMNIDQEELRNRSMGEDTQKRNGVGKLVLVCCLKCQILMLSGLLTFVYSFELPARYDVLS